MRTRERVVALIAAGHGEPSAPAWQAFRMGWRSPWASRTRWRGPLIEAHDHAGATAGK